MEKLILKKLDGGLRGIKYGTKTIEQAKIMYFLEKLKKVNEGLYQDYFDRYTELQKKKENCV